MKRCGSVAFALTVTLAVALVLWRTMDRAPRRSPPGPEPAIRSAGVVSSRLVEQTTDEIALAKKTLPAAIIRVTISPEARVQASAVEGPRKLRRGDWTTFRVVIQNAAGITAPLVIESEQLMRSDGDNQRDRWLQLSLEPTGPLTGQRQETRTLRLFSRDAGIRTALLNVNAGQGTQDLGFRSDVLLSFKIVERAE